ncbi:MAG: hypothetical protein ABI550_08035 [Ignavibacteriaceae bacterium]
MKKLDLNKEWNFVISEIHNEKAKKNNVEKRELLFILQLLLTNSAGNFQKSIYLRTKERFLNLK